MSQFDLVVAAIEREQSSGELVEANWLTSLIMAPFKALFWGVTFLIKVVAAIAFVAGVGAAVSIGLFGAFVWFITGRARGKFRSWEEARRANPKKADQAKQFMRETQDNLSDPRVRNELRSDPKAAEAIHGAYADAGFEDRAAASVIAIACADLPDDGIVTADWQQFFESPIFVGLAFALSLVLGGWGAALTAFLWYMAGIATYKWASASDASRHDQAKTVEAQKSAVKIRRKLNHPALRSALRKSPKALKVFNDTLASLEPAK